MKTTQDKALEIAQLLEDGKGDDVVVLDISELNSWTDFFVITTINSSAHWQGLYRQVKDYIKDNDLEIHLTNKKSPDGDDWNLIDLGNIVVHLMSKQARVFYDLEKLWHNGKKLDYKKQSSESDS
ncbi:MAG: ribosome silencing factor [Treponema sp.]